MPPKKKGEEEPPPAEELLPAGYSIGCEVHWVTFTAQLESGAEVRPGMKGTLEALGDIQNEIGENDQKRWFLELVSVKFEELESAETVPLASLSLDPPPLELLDALSTGLRLALRGVDVEKLWNLGDNAFDKQSEMLMQMLGLQERYGTGRRDILVDYHLYNLTHAKCLCLSPVQGAVFHAIMDEMLKMMTSTAVTPDTRPADVCTAEVCFKEFQRLFLMHARQDPPHRLGIFRDSEVRLLTDFASVTLFKHFLLYQYCINFDREIEVLRFNPHLERPSPPPDLKLSNMRERRQPVAESSHHIGIEQSPELPTGPEEQTEPTEEEKVAQLVQEKLEEVRSKLEERLQKREAEFHQRLEEERKGGKKK
jgi:hypothetical protein|mmetsp:Transcript_50336/g.79749  ORF Transcript_50336/g.79749 Transcript_50336/m.79749 type:complete len:367 (-) Transcript_50336:111-1211(-)